MRAHCAVGLGLLWRFSRVLCRTDRLLESALGKTSQSIYICNNRATKRWFPRIRDQCKVRSVHTARAYRRSLHTARAVGAQQLNSKRAPKRIHKKNRKSAHCTARAGARRGRSREEFSREAIRRRKPTILSCTAHTIAVPAAGSASGVRYGS